MAASGERQAPAIQSNPFAQSNGLEQAVRQLVTPQANGLQPFWTGVLHAPAPLHVAICTSVPLAHDGGPHS
jgi:hypothetical protein